MTTKPISGQASRLLALLSHHIGKENGIGVRELSTFTAISERDIRKLVTELRLDGKAVMGKPRTGYYIARDADDIDETIAYLRNRALTSLRLARVLRRHVRPNYAGQLNLKT
jgi:biotin operon repressor